MVARRNIISLRHSAQRPGDSLQSWLIYHATGRAAGKVLAIRHINQTEFGPDANTRTNIGDQ
jgi:hypothetical protein